MVCNSQGIVLAVVNGYEGDKGDILVNNGTKWSNLPVGVSGQLLAPNTASTVGVSWQNKGYSYLTDELGNSLTDQLGNSLEGLDGVNALLLVNIQVDYTNSFLLMGG